MAESSLRRRSVEPVNMSSLKAPYHLSEGPTDKSFELDVSPADEDARPNDHGNSSNDSADMLRLGKKQEFKRNFDLWSAIGFVAIYMATWEFVLITMSVGFTNGGYAAMFWCFVTTTVSYSAVVASLAEMSSMAPTSGGGHTGNRNSVF